MSQRLCHLPEASSSTILPTKMLPDTRNTFQQWLWRLWLSCLLLTAPGTSPAAAKPPCPAQAPCQCTGQRMTCVQEDSAQLHYLPSVLYFVPSSPQTRWSYTFHEMRIRDQAMTNLTLAYNWGVLSVRRLEVTNSLVRRLLPGAFRGLADVKSLNLSHNLLSEVGPEDLKELTSLEELVLHNNLIKTVHTDAFAQNGLIARLYLSHNQLSEIPAKLRSLGYLTHLYLQFNNISRIPERAFTGLRRLIILDLGALRADLSIDSAAFCGLAEASGSFGDGGSGDGGGSGLVALYLRGNILRDLDLCALGRAHALRGLNLTGSFFPCSCHAASFADRADWQRRYGFAPRYVTYEPGLLSGCDLSDCPRRPSPCPDYCAAAVPPLPEPAATHAVASASSVMTGRHAPAVAAEAAAAGVAAAAAADVEIGGGGSFSRSRGGPAAALTVAGLTMLISRLWRNG